MIEVWVTKIVQSNMESFIKHTELQNAIVISSKSLIIFSNDYVEHVHADGLILSIEYQDQHDSIVFISTKDKIPGKFEKFLSMFGSYDNIIGSPSLFSAHVFDIEKIEYVPGFYIRYLLAYKVRRQLEIEIVDDMIVKSAYPELKFGDIITHIDNIEVHYGKVVNIQDYYRNLDPSLPEKYVLITHLFTPPKCSLTIKRGSSDISVDIHTTESWSILWPDFSITIGDLVIDEFYFKQYKMLYYSLGIKKLFRVCKVLDEKYLHMLYCYVILIDGEIPVSKESFNKKIKQITLLKAESYGVQVGNYIYTLSSAYQPNNSQSTSQ